MPTITPRRDVLDIPTSTTSLQSTPDNVTIKRRNTPRSVKKGILKTPRKARVLEDIEQENLLKSVGKLHNVFAKNGLDDFQPKNGKWDNDTSPSLKIAKALYPTISPSPLGVKSRNTRSKVRFSANACVRMYPHSATIADKKPERSARSKAWEEGRPIRLAANDDDSVAKVEQRAPSVAISEEEGEARVALATRSKAWEDGRPIRVPANGENVLGHRQPDKIASADKVGERVERDIFLARKSKAWEDGQPIRTPAHDEDVVAQYGSIPSSHLGTLDVNDVKPQLYDIESVVEERLTVKEVIESFESKVANGVTSRCLVATAANTNNVHPSISSTPISTIHNTDGHNETPSPVDLPTDLEFETNADTDQAQAATPTVYPDSVVAGLPLAPVTARDLELELECLRIKESEIRYHSAQLVSQAETSAENERILRLKATKEADALRIRVAEVSSRIVELETMEKSSVISLEESMARLAMMSEGLDELFAEKENLREVDKVQKKALTEYERVLSGRGLELGRYQELAAVYKDLLADLAKEIRGAEDRTLDGLMEIVEDANIEEDDDEDDWLDLDEVSYGL